MDRLTGRTRRRITGGIIVGALFATALVAATAGADVSRQQVFFEKLCAAESSSPRFVVQNLTDGVVEVRISGDSVAGRSEESAPITLAAKRGTEAAKRAAIAAGRLRSQLKDRKTYKAPAAWPQNRGSGKYFAHYTITWPDGSKTTNKVAEFCKCGPPGSTSTSIPTVTTTVPATTTTTIPTTTTTVTIPPTTTTTTVPATTTTTTIPPTTTTTTIPNTTTTIPT